MWLFFIALHVLAMNYQDREEFCYTLAMKSIKERLGEIKEHIEKVKIISEPAVKSKLVEDAYEMCMGRDELNGISGDESIYKGYKTYEKLVKVPLVKYQNYQDLKIGFSFSQKKAEISRRAMMKPRIFIDEL